MSCEISISVKNLQKKYKLYNSPLQRLGDLIGINPKGLKEIIALDAVSFEVRKGETVGIIGTNGSGKSTLLQMICGTLSPTKGQVNTNGRIAPLLELGAGFNPEFTGRENVYLNSSILGMSREDVRDRFDDIAAFADIGEFLDRPVKTYSSGMYARLAFSTAVHIDPDILIIDEILAVGDSRFQRKCIKKFNEIRDRGCTILFVSHDDYQVRNICNRALYLDKGSQKYFGDADEAVQLYLGDLQQKVIISSSPLDASEKNCSAENLEHKLVEIKSVRLLNDKSTEVDFINSGESISLEFEFSCIGKIDLDGLVFVFNLYRKDGVYICGTTTAMRGIDPYPVCHVGKVRVDFPSMELLAGIYNWRVAVNDKDGVQILSEAYPVCEFTVKDSFKAVGIYNINHCWNFVEGK